MTTNGKPRTGSEVTRNSHKGIQGHIPPPKGRGRKMRSAITSGRQLFVDGDSNSAWGRRYADLVVGHVLDAGGKDNISEATFSLIKRASALETTIEALEARLSRGLPVNLDEFGRAASHLRRLFEAIGIERRQKDVTPNYLEAKYELED